MICTWCGGPIPVPRDRRRTSPGRRYCGRPCYDAKRRSGRIEDRFWSHVRKTEACWEWDAAKNRLGYGAFGLTRERMTPAHRFAWELTFGPIPPGMYVCHHCDNPSCVRPDHLFLGTPLANTRDMDRKGRRVTRPLIGERNPGAKLTEAQVVEIRRRRAAGEQATALAAEFGVSRPLIAYIVNGKAWRHVA